MVSELVTDHLVVVLNKVDLLPAEQRDRLVAKARKRLAATFALTKFKGCAMVPVAAKPGAWKRTTNSQCGKCTDIDAHHSGSCLPDTAQPRVPPYSSGLSTQLDQICDMEAVPRRRSATYLQDVGDMNPCSARGAMFVCAGGGDEEAKASPVGIDQLRQELAARLPPWPRSPDGPFLFAVDHCFAIRGQGTVLTGTVLQVLPSG